MASHPDPVELITRLGARFSPSLDDYATGQIERCARTEHRPTPLPTPGSGGRGAV